LLPQVWLSLCATSFFVLHATTQAKHRAVTAHSARMDEAHFCVADADTYDSDADAAAYGGDEL